MATGALRNKRVEAILVEVVQHRPHSVLGGEGDLGDRGHVHALTRPQHDLGSSPSHHRTRAAADDAQQLVAFLVRERTDSHAFGQDILCATARRKWWTCSRVAFLT
jgi:hypothetical protein